VPPLQSSALFCWVRSEFEYQGKTRSSIKHNAKSSFNTGERRSPVFLFAAIK